MYNHNQNCSVEMIVTVMVAALLRSIINSKKHPAIEGNTTAVSETEWLKFVESIKFKLK